MHPFDPPRPYLLSGGLDASCHFVRRFHRVHLDVDHADAKRNARIEQLFEISQLVVSTECEFEHNMIAMEAIHEVYQLAPLALLNRLSPIIAEADVHALLFAFPRGVEDEVD